ncbi:rhomboid family intramembrane serine protease [Ekhidna sp.]|jgi:membrane associated rhomboid family serine protease|uniref:rhomboid family intramembrane serine protease n=1 Tax=Ekhidna sp. TaxID=2608089 RepID=UPI0032EFA284
MNGGIKEEFSNAWSKPNNAVVQIILINLIVFVAARVFKVFFDLSGATDTFFWVFRKLQLPADVGSLLLQPWSLVTYFFTHFDFFHILFNMLFLFWFGRIIQEFLNSKRVISLYVLGGLAGGLLYIFIYNFLPFYADRVTDSMMLGASAGVYAIVVGAAVFMPNYTFFLIFIGPVKIKYIAIFYVFMSFIGTTGANAGGEIAHLGGALVGWLYISQLNKGSDMGGWVINFIHFVKSLFKPQPKIKVTHRSGNRRPTGSKKKSGTSKGADQTPQSEIDAILDKISESGYESLTKDEKQKLFNASKK